jgi:energy-coupling factor transporter ATP-binding protein EcfA2
MNEAVPISDNPFCTRRIRPGALDYIFSEEDNLERLIVRLGQNKGWGQIIGPHGSGKSTLLESLLPALQQHGWTTTRQTLHDGQRRLPISWQSVVSQPRPTLLVIDGYEQLSRWSRMVVKRFCRRNGLGLLVTSHTAVGLPDLYRTKITPELAKKVVDQLLAGKAALLSSEELTRYVSRFNGDLRETLFTLYDLYEQRRPS